MLYDVTSLVCTHYDEVIAKRFATNTVETTREDTYNVV